MLSNNQLLSPWPHGTSIWTYHLCLTVHHTFRVSSWSRTPPPTTHKVKWRTTRLLILGRKHSGKTSLLVHSRPEPDITHSSMPLTASSRHLHHKPHAHVHASARLLREMLSFLCCYEYFTHLYVSWLQQALSTMTAVPSANTQRHKPVRYCRVGVARSGNNGDSNGCSDRYLYSFYSYDLFPAFDPLQWDAQFFFFKSIHAWTMCRRVWLLRNGSSRPRGQLLVTVKSKSSCLPW